MSVTVVTQTSCEPELRSSTGQWGMQFALLSAAVHFCCVTAHLYGQQSSLGVIAVTQASYESVLQSRTKQW